MTAHSFSRRRLLISACAAMAGLTLFIGMYTHSTLQSRALEREMASVQPFWLDGSASQLAHNHAVYGARLTRSPDPLALGL
jgi:hypothetical protein